jgi:hypothetical protein
VKYHLVIWTDDGIKREFDVWWVKDLPPDMQVHLAELGPNSDCVQITDVADKRWFFNWNHVLGGTIQKVEEK